MSFTPRFQTIFIPNGLRLLTGFINSGRNTKYDRRVSPCRAEYGYDQRMEVFGSKGSVSINNDTNHTAKVITKDGALSDKPKWLYLERYNNAFKEELRSFFHCVATGAEPIVSAHDGLQAELLAHAATISLKEKRPVKIQEVLKQV